MTGMSEMIRRVLGIDIDAAFVISISCGRRTHIFRNIGFNVNGKAGGLSNDKAINDADLAVLGYAL